MNSSCRGSGGLARTHELTFALATAGAAPYFSSVELVVTLLILGVILLLLETILPGMIAGIIGACCLIAGVALAYRFGAHTGNLVLFIVLLVCIGGFVAWVRLFPTSRVGKRVISDRVVGNIDADRPELLNQTGTAFTNLRPAGTAVINGKRVDVVTEGGMIAKGTPVKVVAIEGMRVVVRAVNLETANPVKPITS